MTKPPPKMSLKTLEVISQFLENSPRQLSGSDIVNATGMLTGTLYPILARLAEAGWLEDRWEEVDASEVGRPPRRFYQLTALGRTSAKSELKKLEKRLAGFKPIEGTAGRRRPV